MDKGFLFLLPLATAFTAWGTSRAILYFVLYPVKQVRVFGFPMQGFLIKNQNAIAVKIGEGIANELATADVSSILAGDNTLKALNPMIEQHLDNYLRVRLKEKMPVIASFIGDSTIEKLKEGMMEEIAMLLPEVITKYAANLAASPAIQEKITNAIANYPASKVAAMIAPELKKAMAKLPALFGIIGIVIGVILAAIMYTLT